MKTKENFLRAIKHKNPKWVPYGGEAVITIFPPIIERPDEAGRDVFGVEWKYNPEAEGGTYPEINKFVITDIKKWKDQFAVPNVEDADWTEIEKTAGQVNRNEYLIQGFCEMGIFERTCLLMGMEQALMSFYTNPDDMYDLCGTIADYKIAKIKKYYEAIKFDILWYGDDWGTQSNLFVSPKLWRKIIKPHTQRIYDCLKGLGVIINQHSCGKIQSVFSDLCEMGADIWNPCQPCNDLKMLKQTYGDKIAFWGGIDSQFILDNDKATLEDVRNEVVKRIYEMSLPNGGYIIGPSHTVPYDKAKLEVMEKVSKEYGSKIYKGTT